RTAPVALRERLTHVRSLGRHCTRRLSTMNPRTMKRMFGIALAFVLGVGIAVAPPVAKTAPYRDTDEDETTAVDDATQGELRANRRDGTALGTCPLEHTDVKAEVSGFLARVTV